MNKSNNKSPRAIWAWACYDFANSPFTTLIVTFIYAAYFTKVMAVDEIQGTALWSRGLSITALVVALLSPIMGALADRGGYRKLFLLIFTALAIAGLTLLYGFQSDQILLALTVFVIANICYEMAGVFYNAYLPDIAPADKIGRVSGYGWALGYVGGLLALVLALFTLVQPETPWFGFSKENGENIRATNLLVALWFAIFSIPIFLWVKDDPKPSVAKSNDNKTGSTIAASFRQLINTFKEIRRYRQVVRFLFARLLYIDGLITIFAFGGIYAAGTLGFTIEEILLFGIVLNLTAGIGAFALGFLDDILGGKKTIQISLIGLFIAAILALLATDKTLFWIAGIIIGIFSGPVQAASRSLMGRFTPEHKVNEFFGFFAFSGKATAFLGPLLLGLLTEAFHSQRAGMSIVLVLFAAGFVLLFWLDEDEGIAAAGRI